MRKYKYKEIDWINVQKDYDNNLSLKDLIKKYNISRTCLNTAIKKGFFIKDEVKKYGHKHTEKTKKILSIKQHEYLKNNPDKHPWKKKGKFNSIPCEYLKNELRKNNISFVEEFGNFEKFNYSIDIAFPNDKIGIEVNGNQHYNKDGSLTDYYKKREDDLKSIGWKLYQIHYSLVYNKVFLKLIIDQIKKDIKNLYVNYSFIIPDKEKIKEERTCKNCKRILNYELNKNHICKKCQQKIDRENKNEELKEKVLSSSIEFSKFGWVGKVAILINKKPQKIKEWMIKYMKEFYEQKCFKRK